MRAALLAATLSCGGATPDTPLSGPKPPALASIVLSSSLPGVEAGQSATVAATGVDQNGAPISVGTVAWTTLTPIFAVVSATTPGTATVIGIAPGPARIMATAGGIQAVQSIDVTPDGTASPSSCPAPATGKVLVDATHDGGAWWIPQPYAGKHDVNAPHQGKPLADYLRSRGFDVTEMGLPDVITRDILLAYPVVISVGGSFAYSTSEKAAYVSFAACPRTLLLLSVYLRPGENDALADTLGIPLTGFLKGTITKYVSHPITEGVGPMDYIAGSVLAQGSDPGVQVLGTLSTGEPVIGILQHGNRKIFWVGTSLVLTSTPQPLLRNLVSWGF